ncbi:MAG: prepilin-type N-terminal cleavage/methylation domain-containing protein [Thermodesulfovibrionia bacterium]|nr:prepilin-type N-terminal cleavage/methylation domain-containing protein [Thermodesulfovibrionia bacterium]MCK5426594.1 prepilin-type N-terminal cleavage/methylation domain-containing protein [Thermodesulfovibrionia bacterium]
MTQYTIIPLLKSNLRNFKTFNLNSSFRNSQSSGFTLIELIIVIIIIGIALGLSTIFIRYGGGGVELNTFVKELSATLRYARSHSVAEKKKYSFILWEDRRAYGLYVDSSADENDIEDPQPLIYKTVPESIEVILKDKKGEIKIDFFPLGNSGGGILEIKNQKGKTFFIKINKITGRVEVEKSLV